MTNININKEDKVSSYEAIVALNASLEKEKIDTIIGKFQNKIKSSNGTVEKTDHWGLRRLPFVLKKHKKLKEAYYVYILFNGETTIPQQLRNLFRVTEEVIRFSIIKPGESVAGFIDGQSMPEEEKVEIAPAMLEEVSGEPADSAISPE
jgi:small subunit ribosomal protein S6